MPAPVLLEVVDLSVVFRGPASVIRAVSKVSLRLGAGEILGLVGESGSGKSVTLRAIMGLTLPPGRVTSGQILLRGVDLLALEEREIAANRGLKVGMIFQNSMNALNPVKTVGNHLTEVLRVKKGMSKEAALEAAVDLLQKVGIPGPAARMKSFPHHLSGGMQQRVMIALALAGNPDVILADEPTTALDVTIQDQILSLLMRVQHDFNMGIVLVSHDLDLVAEVCDHVAVMYAGYIVEFGETDAVISRPRHPYTEALLKSAPSIVDVARRHRFAAIGGQPPALDQLPQGCPFAPRCAYVRADCAGAPMVLDRTIPSHGTACVLKWNGDAD